MPLTAKFIQLDWLSQWEINMVSCRTARSIQCTDFAIQQGQRFGN